ncbi:MAG TPA: hypothetical protein EYQ61_11275 [Dehalococcoidia bacterium]|nr:hypothetical protein [Dehalococcoidia bacterium]HIK89972.1 hypothetical protein [Dehalococcoidia bacterium]
MSYVPMFMVIGMVMPFIGPAVDHHYVDRSPAHAHVLVGEETNIHDHSLSLSIHDHSSGPNGDGVSLATSTASSVHGPLTLDGATLESSIPSYDHHLIAMFTGVPPALDAEAASPLERPPRLG